MREIADIGTKEVTRLGQKLITHRVAHTSRKSVDMREKPMWRNSAPGCPVMVAERNDNRTSSMCQIITHHRISITRPQGLES